MSPFSLNITLPFDLAESMPGKPQLEMWKPTASQAPASHQPAALFTFLSKPQAGCCPGPFSHPHTHLTTLTPAFKALH